MPESVVRVAALADLHCTKTSQGVFQPLFARITDAADILLLAGDLTDYGLPEEARAKEQIELEFSRAGLAVPGLKEVLAKLPVEGRRAQKLLQILLREQVLVKVTEDLVFHRAAIARLRGLLADYKQKKGDRLPIAVW